MVLIARLQRYFPQNNSLAIFLVTYLQVISDGLTRIVCWPGSEIAGVMCPNENLSPSMVIHMRERNNVDSQACNF